VRQGVGDLRQHTGYLPATHGREYVVNCVTHSNLRQLVCGHIVCSVLVQLDEDTGDVIGADAALELGGSTSIWSWHTNVWWSCGS
jgi:hypothetical protein